MTLSRRSFLSASALSGAIVLSRGWVPAVAEGSPVFLYGVASGDPLPDAVVLWTHVTVPSQVAEVGWEVARDLHFRSTVATGSVRADAAHDHTAKVDVVGLDPDTTYFYRFTCRGETSPVGRTRTAPVGTVLGSFRMAVVSCAQFNPAVQSLGGYHALAARDDVDVVLVVGDYIYEGPAKTREGYWARYRRWRSDAGLQRAHQVHPFVCMWDDHEIANEPWDTGAEFHDPERDGPWEDRKRAATQAFWDWMPCRQPDVANPQNGWRRLRWGNLVDLIVMDARLHRSRWLIEERDTPFQTFYLTEADEEDRTILGWDQESWVYDRLFESNGAAAWRVLTSGIPVAPWAIPGLPQLPPSKVAAIADTLGIPLRPLEAANGLLAQTGVRVPGTDSPVQLKQGGNSISVDKWDGYPAARRRLVEHLRSNRIPDTIIASGDLHFVNDADVPLDPWDPSDYDPVTGRGSVAAEFVCPGIASGNFDEAIGGIIAGADPSDGFLQPAYDPTTLALCRGLEAGSLAANPHHKYNQYTDHGWVVLDITYARVSAEHWYTDDRWDPDTDSSIGFILDVDRWSGRGEPTTHMRPSLRSLTMPNTRSVPRPAPAATSR
jgi:alkaline phosphatase D